MEEPTTNLIMINTWVNDGTHWQTQLAAHNYNFNGPNTVIIDEAQLRYWDTEFWNSYLKDFDFRSCNRIILFVSWGNPIGRVSAMGTKMVVPTSQIISLRPVDHQDELPPGGLFLSADEFSDMIKVAFPNGHFAADFLDHVLHLTAGHAGAVHDMLRIVMDDTVSLCIKPQNSLTIVSSRTVNLRRKPGNTPWKSFKANFLSMPSGAPQVGSSEEFSRGLPRPDDLQEPFIAQILRRSLANNQVASEDVANEDEADEDEELQLQDEKDALKLCFRNGWLHATTDNDIPVYIFATPLHQGFVEYYLGN